MLTFISTINVVLPICLMVGLGIFLRSRRLLQEDSCRVMNDLAFRVLLPCLAFSNIHGSVQVAEYGKLLVFAGAGYTGALLLLMVLVPLFIKENENRGVVIQGCLHNSFLIFGMSICGRLYPGETPSALAILATVALPANHIASTVALQVFNNQSRNFKKMVRQIVKNPILIACVAAILCNSLNIWVPDALLSASSTLSGAAIPICLLSLGANFQFSSIWDDWKPVLAASFIKLAALPLVFVWMAARFGVRGMPMLAVLMFFGSPTAPVTYTLTTSMGGNKPLAAKMVLFSNCLSIVSLFCFIYILLKKGLL